MATYIDSSAAVKLILRIEACGPEVAAFIRARRVVSSELTYTETRRALLARSGTLSSQQAASVRARGAAMFARVGMVSIDRPTIRLAAQLPGPHLRTLDALHVATALRLGSSVTEFVTYDRRQAEAAADASLAVVSPGLT